jgi:hypothetical protein
LGTIGAFLGWALVIVILVIVVASFLTFAANVIIKSISSMQGKDRCRFCKAKLTFASSSYAQLCTKCGRDQ